MRPQLSVNIGPDEVKKKKKKRGVTVEKSQKDVKQLTILFVINTLEGQMRNKTNWIRFVCNEQNKYNKYIDNKLIINDTKTTYMEVYYFDNL